MTYGYIKPKPMVSLDVEAYMKDMEVRKMVNYEKCPVWEEDTSDIDFLLDKLIADGLTDEERKELDFLRALNGM